MVDSLSPPEKSFGHRLFIENRVVRIESVVFACVGRFTIDTCLLKPSGKIWIKKGEMSILFMFKQTDQTSVWYTFERASKSNFLLQKRKIEFCRSTICLTNYIIGWDKSKIIITNQCYHRSLCLEAWHSNWSLFTPHQKKGSQSVIV